MPRNTKPLERDILAEIRAVFARIPWVILWHNKERYVETAKGAAWFPGLCEGSADLIGIIQLRVGARHIDKFGDVETVGVFLAIETKQPGKKPRPDQTAFLERVRAMGGVAGWCSSVAGAVEIVYAARGYRAEDLAELNAACVAARVKRAPRDVRVV